MIPSNTEKIKQLQSLIDDNFRTAKHSRAIMEFLPGISLGHYFQKIAAKRSQFALELIEKLQELEGKKPFLSESAYEYKWPEISKHNQAKNIRKNLKIAKDSLIKYKRALSKINEGSCREVLIRHKAIIAGQVTEINALKKLIREKDQNSGNNSDSFKPQREFI